MEANSKNAANLFRPERAWAVVRSKAHCEAPCEGQIRANKNQINQYFKHIKISTMFIAKFKYAILDLILVFICSLAVILFVF